MTEQITTLEQLLYEQEGTALDFKASQYSFYGAEKRVKSELLKDILAFANSWRRTDAFILIGVQENPGGRAIVVGIADHLKDADLQQFVNSKTNRPIEFSYAVQSLEGKEIGVIKIPLQQRPFYVEEDYGKVDAHTVPVRRGSSTAIASLDEVARIGGPLQAQVQEPDLALSFIEENTHRSLGSATSIQVEAAQLPERSTIPDYRGTRGPFGIDSILDNQDFYRDVATSIDHAKGLRELFLLVHNEGDVPAYDVVLKGKVDDPGEILRVIDESDYPRAPSRTPPWLSSPSLILKGYDSPHFEITRIGSHWSFTRSIGKVQPKAERLISGLFVGALKSCSITLRVELFADNLARPVEAALEVQVDVASVDISVEELVQYANFPPEH